ncbi:nucleotide pyrophosphohydrolase [Vagococcus silagei]|uniref:Nucleotide pyrophosphohydrolase n=1 Tax=Vagococcus silagei TaxID=2508885 RepID=A0A4S3B6T7_9ENTE|nr:nucleotide pyrophosphohydrolase [Vagococcus silagei]THB61296.1 nucleotide pyrophosphohydrolase [Vagococcus silagei]
MKQEKNIAALQEELAQYIAQFEEGYFSPTTQVLNLVEEVGELAREINHHYGEKKKKNQDESNHIEEELGDVLIALIIMANSLKIDLADSYESNMQKFKRRDHNRFERLDRKEMEQTE